MTIRGIKGRNAPNSNSLSTSRKRESFNSVLAIFGTRNESKSSSSRRASARPNGGTPPIGVDSAAKDHSSQMAHSDGDPASDSSQAPPAPAKKSFEKGQDSGGRRSPDPKSTSDNIDTAAENTAEKSQDSGYHNSPDSEAACAR